MCNTLSIREPPSIFLIVGISLQIPISPDAELAQNLNCFVLLLKGVF